MTTGPIATTLPEDECSLTVQAEIMMDRIQGLNDRGYSVHIYPDTLYTEDGEEVPAHRVSAIKAFEIEAATAFGITMREAVRYVYETIIGKELNS